MEGNGMMIFSGNSNPDLADKICAYLHLPLGNAKITTFSDGESQVAVNENVRGKDVFVIQSTCKPVNDNLMELLLLIDTFKRSSARRITVVLPYYGYARQDKKKEPRVPISAKLVADMLTVAGAHRVITMDLHAGQIQGFFNIPVDNLFFSLVLIPYIRKYFDTTHLVIVSPDAGGVERARAFAKRLNAGLGIIDKRRDEPNKAKAMNVIGNVDGKVVIVLDDMVDTAGTLIEAADALSAKGAIEIHTAAAHAVLSGPALDRIKKAKKLRSLIFSDSIPLSTQSRNIKKIKILSVDGMIGEAMKRSFHGDSVHSLFI